MNVLGRVKNGTEQGNARVKSKMALNKGSPLKSNNVV